MPDRFAGRRDGDAKIRGPRALAVRVGRSCRQGRHDRRSSGPKSIAHVESLLAKSQDAGLERPLWRLRAAALRRRHQRRRADRRETDGRGQAALGRWRRRHGGGVQPGRRRADISPMFRQRAARSSSGSRASRCRASRRCFDRARSYNCESSASALEVSATLGFSSTLMRSTVPSFTIIE